MYLQINCVFNETLRVFTDTLRHSVRVFTDTLHLLGGTAVAQWLRCCATNRKVAGSIPAGVSGLFNDIILPIALCSWGRLSL